MENPAWVVVEDAQVQPRSDSGAVPAACAQTNSKETDAKRQLGNECEIFVAKMMEECGGGDSPYSVKAKAIVEWAKLLKTKANIIPIGRRSDFNAEIWELIVPPENGWVEWARDFFEGPIPDMGAFSWVRSDSISGEALRALPDFDVAMMVKGAAHYVRHKEFSEPNENRLLKEFGREQEDIRILAFVIMSIIKAWWIKVGRKSAGLESANLSVAADFKGTTLADLVGDDRPQNWSKVHLKFLDGESLTVKCPSGKYRVVNFEAVGAVDGRNGGVSKAWSDLKELAENAGDSIVMKRKRKATLAKCLQEFFGIDDDPFESLGMDRDLTRYKPLFQVHSDASQAESSENDFSRKIF